VLADELLPSQFIALDAARVAGICTARGGPTSHVAILAAALNIPMLVAAGAAVREIANGTTLVLDADNAVLHIAPSEDRRTSAESTVARRRRRQAAEREAAQRECRTADGARIEVFANVGSVAEARAARTQGAEGCGLLRTEFLFLERDTPPDEAAQSALYSGIVEAFDGRPVVVRTLDTGGDKPLPYMPLAREENPALGVRGVRISLLYPHVLRAQLRAILNAQPRGRCRILLPMISEPAEVRAIGEMLDDVRRELGHDAAVPLGAMIETPAAAMIADRIAREADFLSIGTNDLTQYALAIDRGNPALASRLDALHPAVLRLIAKTAEGARANCRDVAVCGGLASDPLAAPILIGLGVNELSAVPAVIPRIKALIGTLTLDACLALAQRALEQQTAADVRALVAQFQEPAE
jgi:phosphocarrier protein FPr/phosphocarrier protein